MVGGGDDARQAEQRSRGVVGMHAQAYADLGGLRHDGTEEAGEIGLKSLCAEVAVTVKCTP